MSLVTHHKSYSRGNEDDEEQEAQQTPPPGVTPANRRPGNKAPEENQHENISVLRDC